MSVLPYCFKDYESQVPRIPDPPPPSQGRGHHLQMMGDAGQGEALLMDPFALDPKKAAIV